MSNYVECKGRTVDDCMQCHIYNSLHSLHYDPCDGEKVVEISCSIGGNKKFDEDGNEKIITLTTKLNHAILKMREQITANIKYIVRTLCSR